MIIEYLVYIIYNYKKNIELHMMINPYPSLTIV